MKTVLVNQKLPTTQAIIRDPKSTLEMAASILIAASVNGIHATVNTTKQKVVAQLRKFETSEIEMTKVVYLSDVDSYHDVLDMLHGKVVSVFWPPAVAVLPRQKFEIGKPAVWEVSHIQYWTRFLTKEYDVTTSIGNDTLMSSGEANPIKVIGGWIGYDKEGKEVTRLPDGTLNTSYLDLRGIYYYEDVEGTGLQLKQPYVMLAFGGETQAELVAHIRSLQKAPEHPLKPKSRAQQEIERIQAGHHDAPWMGAATSAASTMAINIEPKSYEPAPEKSIAEAPIDSSALSTEPPPPASTEEVTFTRRNIVDADISEHLGTLGQVAGNVLDPNRGQDEPPAEKSAGDSLEDVLALADAGSARVAASVQKIKK